MLMNLLLFIPKNVIDCIYTASKQFHTKWNHVGHPKTLADLLNQNFLIGHWFCGIKSEKSLSLPQARSYILAQQYDRVAGLNFPDCSNLYLLEL